MQKTHPPPTPPTPPPPQFPACSSKTLMRFVTAIEGKYNPENAYHSSSHAADAVNNVWVLMSATSGLEESDKFITLVSAAAHDVGHRGVSNNYLIGLEDRKSVV